MNVICEIMLTILVPQSHLKLKIQVILVQCPVKSDFSYKLTPGSHPALSRHAFHF